MNIYALKYKVALFISFLMLDNVNNKIYNVKLDKLLSLSFWLRDFIVFEWEAIKSYH